MNGFVEFLLFSVIDFDVVLYIDGEDLVGVVDGY